MGQFEERRRILYDMPRHGTYATHSSRFDRQLQYEQQMHELSRDRLQQKEEDEQQERQNAQTKKSISKDE